MTSNGLTLTLLPETFAVCRLAPDAPVPEPPDAGSLYSLTRTATELSIVCREGDSPGAERSEGGWRGLVVDGPLAFEEVGILAAGRVYEQVLTRDGVFYAGKVMPLSLSCDHRVVDGAESARFLNTVVKLLEEPETLVQ